MSDSKPKKSTATVNVPNEMVQRAAKLLPALREQPAYRHLRLNTSDVLRMAAGMGMDALEKDAAETKRQP